MSEVNDYKFIYYPHVCNTKAHALLTRNIIALLDDPLIKYKILRVIMIMSEIILNLDFPFTEIFST